VFLKYSHKFNEVSTISFHSNSAFLVKNKQK
jgi:hypothetical protein